MSFDFRRCTVEQLWRHVAAHLEGRGIGVTLVGGSAASIHSRGAYQSGDLDFVTEDLFAREQVDPAMEELGFLPQGRHFVHPECPHLFVDFVPGPLGIGEDTRIQPMEVREGAVTIKVLSPTDCVRDRLGGFIHHGTRDQLEQAALVAWAHPIDWKKVERWARKEAPTGAEAYAELRRRVAARG